MAEFLVRRPAAEPIFDTSAWKATRKDGGEVAASRTIPGDIFARRR
jgi:hypothetical protein